ncbi:hypothetical protein F511_20833 [Dorcoceras hygrometricum]|uniref:Uncharacterized protein n=1 Tax=Dorcoceras hygrometricum TaxID=472368 RepID=A0A2Z7CCW7_9LAMI|nr:hypothetical protein F511_20833 [Dorcoceras hygrometricum]
MSRTNLLLLLLAASALTIESIAYDSVISGHAPTPHYHLRQDMEKSNALKHKPIHPPAPSPSPKHMANEDQLVLAHKGHRSPAPSKPPKIAPSSSRTFGFF